MVIRISGTQPQGPKHLETLENKTVDGTQNTVRVNRGTSANRPVGAIIGDLYYNTEIKDLEQYTEDGWMIVAKQVPRVPTIGSATLDGSNNASISFTPSAYGQPASSYTVQSNPGSYTATASSSPISISGTNLQIGTAYTFRVKSIGTYGESAYSVYSSSVTPVSLSSYESISTITVGASSVGSVTFSNIPSTYKHLQLRISARGDSGSQDWGYFRVNSGATGSSHYVLGQGAITDSSAYINSAQPLSLRFPGSSAGTGIFSGQVIDFVDYNNVNKNKTVRIFGGVDLNGSGQVVMSSYLYSADTAAISSIQVVGWGVGSFVQHSTFALYGIK